jgi:THO complex subunit 1
LLVIEDALDVLPISWIGRIFDYLENNLAKITNDLVPGRGKALPLLRLCNESLRRLSKSENASICGRIQVFLANVFPLSERSGVNLKGLFHTENVTTFDEDVEMQDEKNKFGELYREFWGLQTWFSQPVLLFDLKEFGKFKEVRVY